MSPEDRAYFARKIAANAEAVKTEKIKIKEAEEQTKNEIISKLLARGYIWEDIADITDVSVDFVKSLDGKWLSKQP